MPAAMILAAGLGTRLRPLTDERPKPLLPLGDEPLLVAIARRLRDRGFDPVVANSHHLADAFVGLEDHVSVRHEPSILGTAGGVAGARGLLGDGPVLVWNGDIVADVDPGALLALADPVAWVVAPRPRGQGTVGLDARDRIVRLRDAVVGEEASGGDFLGISAWSPAIVARLPATGCLAGDVAVPHLRAGGTIRALRHDGPWDDVGSPASYLAANLRWLGDRRSFVGKGASIGRATLDRAIVGAGARVEGEGSLERVVVWPGAVARAPLANAIVTPKTTLTVG